MSRPKYMKFPKRAQSPSLFTKRGGRANILRKQERKNGCLSPSKTSTELDTQRQEETRKAEKDVDGRNTAINEC